MQIVYSKTDRRPLRDRSIVKKVKKIDEGNRPRQIKQTQMNQNGAAPPVSVLPLNSIIFLDTFHILR